MKSALPTIIFSAAWLVFFIVLTSNTGCTGQDAPEKPASKTPKPVTTRPAALAGTWYPGTREELADSIDKFLQEAPKTGSPSPMALFIPHAGHLWSGQTAAYAYKSIQGNSYRRI